jgi:menaquinone-9 beta-reductase
MTRADCDVLIVGAGPAGAAAAILLARAGWDVALVERQRFPRRKVCGECIAASNLPLLAALGVGVASMPGSDLRRVTLIRGDDAIVASLPAAPHDRLRWGRALDREVLDALLVEQARAAGARVLQPWSLRAAARVDGGWACELRAVDSSASTVLRAPLLIDAHGSWERLAVAAAPRKRRRRAADLLAFKATFAGAALGADTIGVLALDGGYGGLVVTQAGVLTLAGCVRRDRLEALRAASPGGSAGDVFEAWLRRECRAVSRTLEGASRTGAWLASGPLDPGVRTLADDGLYRIGNAAAEAHPILGEGISMALQSAALLCSHLVATGPRGAGRQEVTRRYAADWQRAFRPRLRVAAVFAHAMMRPRAAALLVGLARRWPGVLPLGARWGGKVRTAVDPARVGAPARRAG